MRDELHGDGPEEHISQPELFDLFGCLTKSPAGPGLTASLASGCRNGYSGTVEQIVDSALGLLTLDVPVPMTVEQLVDVLQFFDAPPLVSQQVIDVPRDHPRGHPAANLGSRAAAGGTAGGSTDDPLLSQRRPLTFQFHVVVGVVFKVFAQDRVQQGLRHPQFPALQLMCSTLRMRRLKRCFALFPSPRKVRGSPGR